MNFMIKMLNFLGGMTMLLVSMAVDGYAQEPRKSSFDDFVFKKPVAYRTPYSNETERILDIYNDGPWTVFVMKDEITILADSADVYVHPYDFLYDPIGKKRYHLVKTVRVPKFERTKYLKGKAGTSTKHRLFYNLYFDRIPDSVKEVVFCHAPQWEKRDEYYAQETFMDIDLTNRRDLSGDNYQWININPKSEALGDFDINAVAKMKESEDGKSDIVINMTYWRKKNDSPYSSITLTLDTDFYLYDPVKKRKYRSSALEGYPLNEGKYIKGWDRMAFAYKFGDVDSDVEMVDVIVGNTTVIKDLKLK